VIEIHSLIIYSHSSASPTNNFNIGGREGFHPPLDFADSLTRKIFFREDTITKKIKEVAVIDFQWSGKGFGICDVMYLVLGAFNLGLWQNEFALEKKLVTYRFFPPLFLFIIYYFYYFYYFC
jgi:hypothetical protein